QPAAARQIPDRAARRATGVASVIGAAPERPAVRMWRPASQLRSRPSTFSRTIPWRDLTAATADLILGKPPCRLWPRAPHSGKKVHMRNISLLFAIVVAAAACGV